MKELPKKFNVPEGYVMVEVFEEETLKIGGIELPASEKDRYDEVVKIFKIGGDRKKVVAKYKWDEGHNALIGKDMRNLLYAGERTFKIIFCEDIKLSWHEQ